MTVPPVASKVCPTHRSTRRRLPVAVPTLVVADANAETLSHSTATDTPAVVSRMSSRYEVPAEPLVPGR